MNRRLFAIDALRGFAALWVAAYHLWNAFVPGLSPQTEPVPLSADSPLAAKITFPIFAYGYVGVGLFFVLSGFCIHLPQARRFHRDGADALQSREFFWRRFWRLYPAYLGSLGLSVVALLAMNLAWAAPPGPDGITARYLLEASGGGYLLANLFFLLPLQPSGLALNGVYWTLVYEVQFYLVYPLLLPLCRRVGFARVAGGLLVVELIFLLVPCPEALKGLQPHFQWFFLRRYFEWFLGMWLAERFAAGTLPSRSKFLGLFVPVGAAGVLASIFPSTWIIHELLLTLATVTLIGGLIQPRADTVGRITHGLAWFGDFSYSIYLVHLPAYRLVIAVETQLPERSMLTFSLAGAAGVLLMLTLARVLYWKLEKPYLPGPRETRPATTGSQASLAYASG